MFVRTAEAGARGSVGLSDGVVWLTDSPEPRPWRAATRSTDFTRSLATLRPVILNRTLFSVP